MSKEMEEAEPSSAAAPFAFANPCSLMVYVIRACARCLGCSTSSSDPGQDPGMGDDENDKDPSEDGAGIESRAAARRPKRPPPSEGRGGQINTSTQ